MRAEQLAEGLAELRRPLVDLPSVEVKSARGGLLTSTTDGITYVVNDDLMNSYQRAS